MRIGELVNHGLPPRATEILDKHGYKELNPLQVEAVRRGLLGGRNLVVVAPTASGKTLIGELALVKHAFEGRMGLYLVPLRALANEKYEEFDRWRQAGLRIGITTGDYESPGEQLGRYDIVVATYERFDSLLRLRPHWLGRIGVVVVDELHMIGDEERGPILEMIMARLLGGSTQIIGLSATIGNPEELSKWLRAELVSVRWRPVRLVEGVYDRRRNRIVFLEDGSEKYENIIHRLGNPALSIALQSVESGKQVLVFVNNRRRAEEWAYRMLDHMMLLKQAVNRDELPSVLEELRESPSSNERERLGRLIENGVAYHHAGLSRPARKAVEHAFRAGVVRVVFATPTLAAGVNLPARRVLVSVKRYNPLTRRMTGIRIFEYKQMAGRAGRPQFDPYGESVIYDASSLVEGLRYVKGQPESVESRLGNERSLRIHLLALIATGQASGLEDVLKVLGKTLFRLQYGTVSQLRYRLLEVLEDLQDWGMVEKQAGGFAATRLGYLTTITYLDPLSTHVFMGLIEELDGDEPGPLWLLHAVAMTHDYRRSRPYINYRVVRRFEEEALMLAEEEAVPKPPEYDEYEYDKWLQAYVHARMLNDWINEAREDEISNTYGVGPGDIYSARDTASWIASSLGRIMRETGRSRLGERLDKLSRRLEYGVKEEALGLVELEGIGRIRARVLIRNGIRSLDELAGTPPEKLLSLPGFGPRLVKNIYEQLRRMGYRVPY